MQRYQLNPAAPPQFKVDYEKELNPQQLEAVKARGGPILVIAGAGSGKTRTLTYRVSHLIESGVDPSRILLVTFTRKAAREMLQRVSLLTQTETKLVWGGTFHHVGNLTLRHHGHLLGIDRNFSILDREDAKDLIEDCVKELGIDTKSRQRFPKPDVLEDIASFAVDVSAGIDGIVEERYPFYTEMLDGIKRVVSRYNLKKEKLNLLDYADLLSKWMRLLSESKEARELYRQRFLHILVDEYQDTNTIQARIIDNLAQGHMNLMVVGDDAQSIYSFRGANFANIIGFPKRYPGAKIFKLETNYRSTPQILELANDSISNNKVQFAKVLVPVKKKGAMPSLVPIEDSSQQAQFVAQRILELSDKGVALSEMAVLYRSHYHSMELQFELARRRIPFQVRSGLRFFEQAHVKDVTSYLKVLCNPMDEIAWKRILKLLPRVGQATADKIWNFLSKRNDPHLALEDKDLFKLLPRGADAGLRGLCGTFHRIRSARPVRNVISNGTRLEDTPSEAINLVLMGGYEEYLRSKYPDYEDRMEDIRQLMEFARQYRSSSDLLSELALLGSIESEIGMAGAYDAQQLVLSSIHQAKGLEWKVVFIIWLNEGRFPSSRSLKSEESIEEERRLFYVALTRAEDELYLCFPMTAHEYKGSYMMNPSRFIQELSEARFERWAIEPWSKFSSSY